MADKRKPPAPAGVRSGWRMPGPGGPWSVWDHGDELVVCEGSSPHGRVAARVPPELARRLDAGGRWAHVVDAACALHVARLLDSDSPVFRKLWQTA